MGGVGLENMGDKSGGTTYHAVSGCALTVIVPAFNEGKIISNHLDSIYDFLTVKFPERNWEIVIIDDGSSDDTGARAEMFAATHSNVRAHRHPLNRGLGGALRTGFSFARGDVVIPLDIDLSYSVEHLSRLIDTHKETGADIVLLSPYMPKGQVSRVPFSRRILSMGANRVLSWCQAGRLHTSTGMVRAYKKALLDKLALHAEGMEINLEILHQALVAGAKVKEIPAHLDWQTRIVDGKMPSRLRAAGIVRQMALVAHYGVRFLRARRAVIQGVVR